MKKILNRKLIILLAAALIIVIGGIAVASDRGNVFAGLTEMISGVAPENISSVEEGQAIKNDFLTNEVAKKIDVSKSSDSIMRGISTITSEKNLTDLQKRKLNDYLYTNTDYTAVMAMYDVLYKGFFTYSDLDDMIIRYNGGESLSSILESCCNEENFEPRQYPEGQIDYFVKTMGITTTELAIAEALSNRGLIDFNIIIDRLCDGESFSSICEELGVINTELDIKIVSIVYEEIEECMKSMNISEEEAFSRISTLKKLGTTDDSVVEYIKEDTTIGAAAENYYHKIFAK